VGKISNQNKYEPRTSSTIRSDDFFIGTSGGGSDEGATITLPVAAILALFEVSQRKKVELTGATEYQDDDFIDADFIYGFVTGQEILTGGFIDSFDSDTGTITIADGFTPFTGTVIFVKV